MSNRWIGFLWFLLDTYRTTLNSCNRSGSWKVLGIVFIEILFVKYYLSRSTETHPKVTEHQTEIKLLDIINYLFYKFVLQVTMQSQIKNPLKSNQNYSFISVG